MGWLEKDIDVVLSEFVEVNCFVFLLMSGFFVLEVGFGIDFLVVVNEVLGKVFF